MDRPPRPQKHLGQHYLKDKRVQELICNDFRAESKAIIEVGPGPGFITEVLTIGEQPLYVVEKDERFKERLNEMISPPERIIISDALDFDFSEFIQNTVKSDATWLVSNLPYNVATPLMVKFLKTPEIKFMTLMIQKEVAEKMAPAKNVKKNTMSSLFALMTTFFNVKQLCKVSPGAFNPPPKVDSTVLSFSRISSPDIPFKEINAYEKFLRKLFKLRRKQIGTVLKESYTVTTLLKVLEENSIKRETRAEVLSLQQVHDLYKAFKK